MGLRSVVHGISLGLVLLVAMQTQARERAYPEVQAWISDVIARIDRADHERSAPVRQRRSRTVVVRVQVAADGFVNRVDIEKSSGMPELDDRARVVVRAAGPFSPPPQPLLTAAGTTDLSFPLRLDR